MKRIGYIADKVVSETNMNNAFIGFSKKKHHRKSVMLFRSALDEQLSHIKSTAQAGVLVTSEYAYKMVYNPKERKIAMLPVKDHVWQWCIVLQIEEYLYKIFHPHSCSCIPGRGTHYFKKILERDLFFHADHTTYFVQIDLHHYFLHIDNDIMLQTIEDKFKDQTLYDWMDEIVQSYPQGLPLGLRISQLLANFYLTSFDWSIQECFRIMQDPHKMAYWRERYVTDMFVSVRTLDDAVILNQGVAYLNDLFDQYVSEGVPYYYRFADNIIICHRDKTFLHILKQLAILHLTRDYLVEPNGDYNVRPTYLGIDVCGYIFYHGYTHVRKRNKVALSKQLKKLREKGMEGLELYEAASSRIGFVAHADARNLFRNENILHIHDMKRLGKKISNKKRKAPFMGMLYEQKMTIGSITNKIGGNEDEKFILLIDYTIDDSSIKKGETRIAIRFRKIKSIIKHDDDQDDEFEWSDEEYYAFSGSKILIAQAQEEFDKNDLPAPTVIQTFKNKLGNEFIKFT